MRRITCRGTVLPAFVVLAAAATSGVLAGAGPDAPAGGLEAAGAEPEEQPFTLEDWPPPPAAARGRDVHERYCAGCHGPTGLGDGPAAALLDPLPRNFQKGNFKFRSTPSGELPTIDDLVRTINCGLNGSSMPRFRLIPHPQKRDVAAWVLHLATFERARFPVADRLDEGATIEELKESGELERIREQVYAEHVDGAQPVPVPPMPEPTAEMIEAGRERYVRECASCHGEDGRGYGPSASTLRDWKGAPIRPRDFTTGVFRAGSTPRDLWLRMKTGLNGTPMPATSGSDEDLWKLVHFILSLRSPEAARFAAHPTSCAAMEGSR